MNPRPYGVEALEEGKITGQDEWGRVERMEQRVMY